MREVFWVALRLGLTSFGGPIAHLGYFEQTYVRERQWLTSAEYAGLVALCQSLPGPTSSQVGFLIGLRRAGWAGALAAWSGFTLPSALLMYGFAVLMPANPNPLVAAIVHGLMLTAVAVVAQAVWSMARTLCPDWQRATLACVATGALVFFSSPAMQLAVMLGGAIGGLLLCPGATLPAANVGSPRPRTAGVALLSYVLLLAVLPGLALLAPRGPIALADIFYRAGALVFGGGHVVLPLLRQELVPNGWVSDARFLSGYGFAQGVPGPLFSIAAYLGAASAPPHLGPPWALIGLATLFLPGLLLAIGGASLWSFLTRVRGAAAALAGVNAAVVGILAAALYDPVWRGGVRAPLDAVVAVLGFALLQRWRTSALAVAAGCVVASVAVQMLSL
jgi:chromate transporter